MADTKKQNTKKNTAEYALGILQRLRTLYILVYNDPRPHRELASEYFFLTGEILEGVSAEALEFHKIPRENYLKELQRS